MLKHMTTTEPETVAHVATVEDMDGDKLDVEYVARDGGLAVAIRVSMTDDAFTEVHLTREQVMTLIHTLAKAVA